MAPKRSEDYGWQHGQMIDTNRFHWKCNYCNMVGMGGGATRLKKHIAGGFSEVSNCPKIPQEIRHAMKIELESSKLAKKKVRDDRDELDKRAAEYPPIDPYEGIGDQLDADTRAAVEASAQERWQQDEVQRHRAQFGRSQFDADGGSGSGSAQSGLARSGSVSRLFDRFKKRPKEKSGRHPNIIDIDPMAIPHSDAQQQRIDTMLKKDKKCRIGRAIAKFFHFSHIPSHAASTPYYRSMISTIQKEGQGVEPPTPYELSNKYLDAEVNDIHEWVKNLKQLWEMYGVTLMCDSWTGPTKMSIVNFLIYCNGKVIFHKSIDATGRFEDADYIYALLEQVLREVGEKCVVQVISDNGANFKKAGKLLMQRHPHLFWTPCAAHCINLMMSDFGEINRVKKTVHSAQRISKYLYNHLWVHALMVRGGTGPGLGRVILCPSPAQKKMLGFGSGFYPILFKN
ncbi:uncharacterized protein LOC109725031 [Ananas comosus]|uniref:Uncharacterized protein LOC109725031 n=1 Tax=Ananas comosus TaxID=4615 RepID=A0A6P5GP56_ANACO|nr:uncharacterized protein LOC109725031 [Ananas comosus]